MSKVSIVKGENRKENITKAVKLIWKDVERAIRNRNTKQLFIKINAIDTNFPAACTHPDALEAVLDIFYDKFDEVIVGDNSFVFIKEKGGIYRRILNKFPNIKFSDLTEFESEDIEFKTINGISIGKVSLLPKKAFTISLALPKTHDTFVYTGCLKNMFGCVIGGRGYLHGMKIYHRAIMNKYVKGNRLKWQNLINVIEKTKLDLSILDAYEGMEGDGPLFGKSIKVGIAMSSVDGIALDKLASKIFGLYYVPYLSMLPASKIEIIKDGFSQIDEIRKKFRLHYNTKYQIMTELDTLIPLFDIRFVISVLKRSYRLKDKIREKLADKHKLVNLR